MGRLYKTQIYKYSLKFLTQQLWNQLNNDKIYLCIKFYGSQLRIRKGTLFLLRFKIFQ